MDTEDDKVADMVLKIPDDDYWLKRNEGTPFLFHLKVLLMLVAVKIIMGAFIVIVVILPILI